MKLSFNGKDSANVTKEQFIGYFLRTVVQSVVLFFVSFLFLSCSNETNGLCFSYDDGTATIVGIENDVAIKETFVVPSKVRNEGNIYIVTSIGDGAFRGCAKIKKVVIPNSIVEIGRKAFSGCSSLQYVTVQNSSMRIAPDAFVDCPSLINRKEFMPSECTISFHMTGFKSAHMPHLASYSSFSCNMYSGDKFYTDGHTVSTDYITIPEGQRWAFKDYDTDYESVARHYWITRPYIRLKTNNRVKTYYLPEDGRDVVFYPGDRIQIGTRVSSGDISSMDVSVVFFVDYQ